MMDQLLAVPKDNVAEISTWGNNCALSCTSVFLVNALLENKLSQRAADNLAAVFNSYYETSLTAEQLKSVFSNLITLPSDWQVVLGPALRAFVYAMGFVQKKIVCFLMKLLGL